MSLASKWDGHHPGMTLHTPFVALFDGEGQRVVSGIAADLAGQYGVKRFNVRTVEYISTGTCLEKDCIEVGFFQAVEDVDQLLLLPPDACGSGCFGAWPVQSVDGGDPGSPYLVFRGGLRMERK